uniref:PID domain-containing protein n=1 Tax=Macrostomum lignano TaxID=282301 RepID=A0A1I8JQM1_9PLAT
ERDFNHVKVGLAWERDPVKVETARERIHCQRFETAGSGSVNVKCKKYQRKKFAEALIAALNCSCLLTESPKMLRRLHPASHRVNPISEDFDSSATAGPAEAVRAPASITSSSAASEPSSRRQSFNAAPAPGANSSSSSSRGSGEAAVPTFRWLKTPGWCPRLCCPPPSLAAAEMMGADSAFFSELSRRSIGPRCSLTPPPPASTSFVQFGRAVSTKSARVNLAFVTDVPADFLQDVIDSCPPPQSSGAPMSATARRTPSTAGGLLVRVCRT